MEEPVDSDALEFFLEGGWGGVLNGAVAVGRDDGGEGALVGLLGGGGDGDCGDRGYGGSRWFEGLLDWRRIGRLSVMEGLGVRHGFDEAMPNA